jgi:hypothetical protein
MGFVLGLAWLAVFVRRGLSLGEQRRARLVGVAVCALLALCVLLIAPAFVVAPGGGVHARAVERSGSLGSLPAGARGVVSSVLGRDDRGFWVSRAGAGLAASNRAQRLALSFSGAAVALTARQGRLSLAVAGVGYGERLRSLSPAAPVAERTASGLTMGCCLSGL